MNRAWGPILSFLLAVIEVILPERKRSARIRARSLSDFSLIPTQHELLGQRITTLLDYKDRAVSDLIRALKYERSGKAAELASEVLADYLHEELASIKTFSARPILLVPMPLHASKERERGFNQVEKIISKLPNEFRNGPLSSVCTKALTRIKPTLQQAKLSRAERLENVSDAFMADKATVKNSHVILIDDVTTTGATLASAAKPLRKAGAIVILIALARA